MRTLIVEDNALFRECFKETLHARFPSMEIVEASNGEEAFRRIEALHPEITFMDIQLPGQNGLKVTQEIKKRHPEITVIFLTGYDWPEYREAAHRYTDYFFSKGSSTQEEILAAVDAILSKRGKKTKRHHLS